MCQEKYQKSVSKSRKSVVPGHPDEMYSCPHFTWKIIQYRIYINRQEFGFTVEKYKVSPS